MPRTVTPSMPTTPMPPTSGTRTSRTAPSRPGAARWAAPRKTLVNSAGALTSVALVIGLGIWGYKLAVRDVTGVPVIAALEGPARIAPGKSRRRARAAYRPLPSTPSPRSARRPAPPTELRLAPRPTGLAEEDLPMAEMGSGTVAPRDTLAPVEEPLPLANTGKALPEPLPDEAPEPILEAPVVADTDAAVALALDEALADPTGTPAASPDLIAASIPGVARSLRPPPRPAIALPTGVVALAAADAAAEAALPGFSDIDPSTLPPGTRLVQLGAFDTEALARDEWNRIAMDFGPLMAGKGRVIQPAESAGRAFFRLRATGFGDLADARRFCAALVGKDLHCIPVQVR